MTARLRLKRFREAMGYSQAELARRIGCDSTFINRIESGERRPGDFAWLIEDLTQDWVEGPIDAREWSRKRLPKAS